MEERAAYKTDNAWVLNEKEKSLIRYIRQLGFGEILVKVQDKVPVLIEKSTEKIKL